MNRNSKIKMINGIFTALITPFKDGKVDYLSLEKLLSLQIESNVAGVIPCGTTGESPTLSHEEHKKIIEFVVKKSKNKIKVIAGTGSNSTEESISLSLFAQKVGADGCLIVTPYYNKPTQEGMYQHFKKIANTVTDNFPVILYNIPGRSVVGLEMPTIKRLAKIKNIIAIKDATGDIDFSSDTMAKTSLKLFSGNDTMNFPLFCLGASGAISVLSNIFPKELIQIFNHIQNNELAEAKKLHYKLWEFTNLLFKQTNPIYIKEVCYLKKIINTNEIRLPLTNLNKEEKKELSAILKAVSPVS